MADHELIFWGFLIFVLGWSLRLLINNRLFTSSLKPGFNLGTSGFTKKMVGQIASRLVFFQLALK
eukprot:10513111-Ditylum_brightwellii.AAC.1